MIIYFIFGSILLIAVYAIHKSELVAEQEARIRLNQLMRSWEKEEFYTLDEIKGDKLELPKRMTRKYTGERTNG